MDSDGLTNAFRPPGQTGHCICLSRLSRDNLALRDINVPVVPSLSRKMSRSGGDINVPIVPPLSR
jgi:hypothetical protein